MDTERERDQEIGRNYTEPAIERGQCYTNKDKKPDRKRFPGLDQARTDIAIIRFPGTHLLNLIIEKFNNERDELHQIQGNFSEIQVRVPCRVKYVDDKSKLMPQNDFHLWFESKEFLPLVANYLPYPLNETSYQEF